MGGGGGGGGSGMQSPYMTPPFTPQPGMAGNFASPPSQMAYAQSYMGIPSRTHSPARQPSPGPNLSPGPHHQGHSRRPSSERPPQAEEH